MYEIGNGFLNGLLEKDEKSMNKEMSTNRSQKVKIPDLNMRHV
jgi:hypothetical protein